MKGLLKSFPVIIVLTLSIALAGSWLVGAEAPDIDGLSAEQLYESNSASVFYMRVLKQDGTLKTVGSGFLIDGAKALTAFHVVEGGASYEAVFDDGVTVKNLKILKSNKDMDLALVALNAGKREGLKLTANEVRHGQKVFAIGYPLKETKIITEGIINTPKAEVNNQCRTLTSAQVAGGMSGGPLMDKYGHVAGLISGSFRNMSNIHICISSESIRSFLEGSKYNEEKDHGDITGTGHTFAGFTPVSVY